jgi:hypothetical protein
MTSHNPDMRDPLIKRLWGAAACLAGAHAWSEWEVRDPDDPSEQVRTCARCGRMKSDAAPAPIKAWKMPLR